MCSSRVLRGSARSPFEVQRLLFSLLFVVEEGPKKFAVISNLLSFYTPSWLELKSTRFESLDQEETINPRAIALTFPILFVH